MLSRNIRRLGSLDSLTSLHHHFIKVAPKKGGSTYFILESSYTGLQSIVTLCDHFSVQAVGGCAPTALRYFLRWGD